jgi:pSer/pThr/pTyr-binding forkhead associated (FHA) protein
MPEWIISLQERVIKRFVIEEGARLTIGRSPKADITIDNTAISRLHTALELHNGIHFLEDLKSLNGTFINGKRIDSLEVFTKQDVIGIGKFRLSAGTSDFTEAASSAVPAMDVDDETIFVAPKGQPPPAASRLRPERKGAHRLAVIDGDASPAELVLDGRSSIKIGRDPAADLRIPGWLVAAAQCYIIDRDGSFVLVPQRSLAGTWLNGLRIREAQPLRRGDIITIRRVKLKYE